MAVPCSESESDIIWTLVIIKIADFGTARLHLKSGKISKTNLSQNLRFQTLKAKAISVGP